DGDRALLARAAALDMERLPAGPGQLRFVLGDTEAELAGVAVGGLVALVGAAASQVREDQADRAADRRVGAEALAEDVRAGVEPDPADDRPVHDRQRRAGVGGRLDAIEVEAL